MSTLRQQLVELQATEDASVARLRELDREYKKVCGEINALRVSMDHQCAETDVAKRGNNELESQLTKSRKDANDLKKQISDLEGTLAISQDTATTLQGQLKKEKDLVSSLRRDVTG